MFHPFCHHSFRVSSNIYTKSLTLCSDAIDRILPQVYLFAFSWARKPHNCHWLHTWYERHEKIYFTYMFRGIWHIWGFSSAKNILERKFQRQIHCENILTYDHSQRSCSLEYIFTLDPSYRNSLSQTIFLRSYDNESLHKTKTNN